MEDPQIPATDEALEALLRGCSKSRPNEYDNSPWDFLGRQAPMLLAQRVYPLLVKLTCDADAEVQRLALRQLITLPAHPPTTAALLEVIAKGPESFSRRADTLEITTHALATLTSGTASGREAARLIKALVTPHLPPASAVTPLAIFEPEYLLDRITERPAQIPFQILATTASMFALYHRGQLLTLLHSLADLPRDQRLQLLERLIPYLEIDLARASSMATSLGLPTPTPTPSRAEVACELGLPS